VRGVNARSLDAVYARLRELLAGQPPRLPRDGRLQSPDREQEPMLPGMEAY